MEKKTFHRVTRHYWLKIEYFDIAPTKHTVSILDILELLKQDLPFANVTVKPMIMVKPVITNETTRTVSIVENKVLEG